MSYFFIRLSVVNRDTKRNTVHDTNRYNNKAFFILWTSKYIGAQGRKTTPSHAGPLKGAHLHSL